MKSNYGSVVERVNISFAQDRKESEEKLKTILKCVYDYANADVDRDIYMNEVQLGPRVDPAEVDRISAWLQTTEKVHNVVRSERHYR